MSAAASTPSQAAPRRVLELSVLDLKQAAYCERIPFYRHCVGLPRIATAAMDIGKSEHERLERIDARRTLDAFRPADGRREYRVHLYSARLHLTGILDLLILSADQAWPVEFKDTTRGVRRNHELQLAAYGLLLDDARRLRADTGYILFPTRRRATPIALTPALKRQAELLLERIRRAVHAEALPPPTPRRGRCVECEYLRFCNDVDL